MDVHSSDRTDAARTARVERRSDREIVVTRWFDAPAHLVFEAWSRPELFQRWWVPRSFPASLVACELDVRVGGGYRLVFGHEGQEMAFFGRYLEVVPDAHLAWTNDEDDDGPVTTVTFEAIGDQTRVVVRDTYPSRADLDEAIASGATSISAMPESLAQLDELLVTQDASSTPS